ncbi:methyltransferase family protein [Endozoicomonas atrinae]|uniref:methyltransferase family protein n=1 Tax=Endozoicomonas atrinae TaxID=1333660 RepID=UPI0008255C81|nr:isoprenylcysteine carboxylmethyltransferase family protein [Endozoicomonas atrinae]
MKSLELKIPPLLLVLLFGAAMWLARKYIPLGFDLSREIRLGLFILFSLLAFGIALAGVISFRKQKTTVNPVNPEAASSLVTRGIYQFTRNPMYLGFAIFLIGWGLWLTNIVALALIPCFILYMTRFQIIPEEKVLETLFGDGFVNYERSVRRWL